MWGALLPHLPGFDVLAKLFRKLLCLRIYGKLIRRMQVYSTFKSYTKSAKIALDNMFLIKDIHLGIVVHAADRESLQTALASPRSLSVFRIMFVCSECWWGAFVSCSDLLLETTNLFIWVILYTRNARHRTLVVIAAMEVLETIPMQPATGKMYRSWIISLCTCRI